MTSKKTSEKMKKVNRYSICVESGINSGPRNYSENREVSSNRPIAFGRICYGINLVANRKSYFDISYEYQPIRLNTLYNLPTQRKYFQCNSLDGRPPWNSSTHIANRDALYPFPKRLESIPKESNNISNNNTALQSNVQLADSSFFEKESLWKFRRLELPRPIRSTYLGYTNAGNVSGDGSIFFGRPPAGLPNPKSSNTVAKCLNWDFMAHSRHPTDVKRNLHQVGQI